jgi:hypothetical protein
MWSGSSLLLAITSNPKRLSIDPRIEATKMRAESIQSGNQVIARKDWTLLRGVPTIRSIGRHINNKAFKNDTGDNSVILRPTRYSSIRVPHSLAYAMEASR